jgi:hypothetical protein
MKKHFNGWWDVGLWVRCWDQSPFLSIGVKNISQTEKKRAKFDRTSRSCWLLFSIMRELSIINLYLADRHEYGILFGSTKKFTKGSQEQKAWFMEGKNGCFTMPMHRRTHRCWSVSFSSKTKPRLCQNLRTRQISPLRTSVSQAQIHPERTTIWVDWGDRRKFADGAVRD